jgi:surface carbohydrate biosynthesis protein
VIWLSKLLDTHGVLCENYKMKKVALIIDNPLRDLDGMVLVAWHLAQKGVEAWLVPMYDQMFDVEAIDADLVLLNYLRPNNANHMLFYRDADIKVVVLDTEGVSGQTPEEFAQLVCSTGLVGLVDRYCVWGDAQKGALEISNKFPQGYIVRTGCPRYDFCSEPWKNALPSNDVSPGYVLINTNFATVNPRFSGSSSAEAQSMIDMGFSNDFTTQYNLDAQKACDGMIELIGHMTAKYPNKTFVLRPHPFESSKLYEQAFFNVPNLIVRQEGTSIQWMNQASILVHLNCTTAIEAHLMGKPALSPKWLDSDYLYLKEPNSVSTQARNLEDFFNYFDILSTRNMVSNKSPLVQNLYGSMDGKSSERVADSILEVLNLESLSIQEPQSPSLRSRVVMLARKLLGYKTSCYLDEFFRDELIKENRRNKGINIYNVRSTLERLISATFSDDNLRVTPMVEVATAKPRMASGKSIRISRNI